MAYNSLIFNSVPSIDSKENKLWQHFKGIEIETANDVFDEKIMNLMDFDCPQRNSVHFFYTLPFSKNKAMVETTWLSKMNNDLEMDYDEQLKNYIENHLNIKNYKINYKENGAIPLFYPSNVNEKNKINATLTQNTKCSDDLSSQGPWCSLRRGKNISGLCHQFGVIKVRIHNIPSTSCD